MYNYDTYIIIIITTVTINTMSAPVTKPPTNKPLAAAGERLLADCGRELLQSTQSTATTVTVIPSTIKENGA